MNFKFWEPKVETKSVQNQLTGSISSIYADTPSSVYMPSDSVSVLNRNRGYANACVKLISQSIADLPYYLYRITSANNNSRFIGRSIKAMDQRILKGFKTGDYTLNKIFEHPFLDLIETSMTSSITEFFYLISQYLLTIGNCYILVKRSPNGSIIDLEVLMSEYMSVKTDKSYNITEFVYQPLLGASATTIYKPEDILHIKRKTAGSMVVGRGVLEECLLSVSLSEESKKFVNSLLNNNCTPSSMIIVKNSIKSEEEATRIKDKFTEQFGGYNRGKSLVTFGDVDVKEMSQNLRDNQIYQLNDFVRKEVCALFSVPADLLDSSDSNRATITTARNNFIKFTVVPMANAICDQMTRQLIQKEYDNTFLLNFASDEALEGDPTEQAELYKSYIDMGVMTKEEVRAKLGIVSTPNT
jgi:HK97 family phage portal protein